MNISREDIIKGLRNPKRGVRALCDSVYRDTTLSLSSRSIIGKNVFEYDWDLLIILDTCRVDALRSVAPEYDFLDSDNIKSIYSVGGSTLEWTANTFISTYSDTITSTGFISANGWPTKILKQGYRPHKRLNVSFLPKNYSTVSESRLSLHTPAYNYGPGRDGKSDQPQAGAETVVDLLIRSGRRNKLERTIGHLIEPHYPWVRAIKNKPNLTVSEFGASPWGYIESESDMELLWNLYTDELRCGLDAVERLLRNFEADRVLITADHGEAFGELGVVGHASGSLHPKVRHVPVVRTSATDQKSDYPPEYQEKELSVEENLRALGYK